MAHFMRWYQGKAPYVIPKCDDKFPFTCPKSRLTAAEYNRGHFTHTAVIVPNMARSGYLVEQTYGAEEYEDMKIGDYVWLVLVPPMHHVSDVFAYNGLSMGLPGSSYSTFGGITLSLVTAKFKEAKDDGTCSMEGTETNHGSLAFPESKEAKQQFLRAGTDITNNTETWLGVGFKIEALPAKRTLADIMGKIAIGCHSVDYQSQDFQ